MTKIESTKCDPPGTTAQQEREYIIRESEIKNFERVVEGFGNWEPILRDIRSRPLPAQRELEYRITESEIRKIILPRFHNSICESIRSRGPIQHIRVPENPCIENGCTDIDNCDEICQHSRIYSPVQMRQAIAQAREEGAKQMIDALIRWSQKLKRQNYGLMHDCFQRKMNSMRKALEEKR
jgi:hypothetical protein